MSNDHGVDTKSVRLKRNLGLMSAVNIIIGVMIGSGIFVSPTAALKYSGSVGLCLIVWTACGVISLLGALCFAELGTVVPRSGAEYAYLIETFKHFHRFWGPLPAFICSWVYVVILRPAEVAVIILTFAEYSIQPFGALIGLNQMNNDDQVKFIKILAILSLGIIFILLLTNYNFLHVGIITYINFVSVKIYMHINNTFSFCKVFVCFVIIGGGIYQLCIGKTEHLKNSFEGTTKSVGNIALAFYNGLWAYDGWSSVTTVTEEIKNPEKNIPRSIMIGVPIITALYVFMNLAYMAVLSSTEMINSPAVALTFGEQMLGPFSFIIPLGVALATFGCAMSIQFGVTRLCFVAGQEGHFLEPLSYVHVKRSTPAPAVILQGILALIFILVGDIETLIEFASFLIWIFYGSAIVCLLVLRKTQSKLHRPYKVPIIVPYFTLFVAVFLSIVPLVAEPSLKFLIALGFLLSGILVYTPFVYFKRRLYFLDKLYYFIQIFFVVVPTESTEN